MRQAPLRASTSPDRIPACGTPPRLTPVTNAEFGRTLGAVLSRPAVLPAPAFGLKLLLGEFANFLLTGARVIPAAAERAGFRFRYRELEPALRSLLQDQGGR